MIEEPVWKVMSVLPSKMPSKCEVVPTVTAPETTHKTLRACAPPASVIRFPFDVVSVSETWKIQAGYSFILNEL